jgi:hypothetical protein
VFIVAPQFLEPQVETETAEPGFEALPVLTETDSRADHGTDNGEGGFVPAFIDFLRQKVVAKTGDNTFWFNDYNELNQDLFSEIYDAAGFEVAKHLIEFTNKIYPVYLDTMVNNADWDDTRSDCRSHCDDCDSGWHTDEYDGPDPDDEEQYEDEYEDEDGEPLTEEERDAARARNQALERRLRRDRERFEENVEREFVCDDDCDSFLERVSEEFNERHEYNISALLRAYETYCRELGIRPLNQTDTLEYLPEPALPVMHAPAILVNRYHRPLENFRTFMRRARA